MRHFKIFNLLVQWIINALALFLLAMILPGVSITHLGSAFAASAVIGLLNAMLWPLFMRFALPVTVATLGLTSLLLNGLIISLAQTLLPDFVVTDIWTAMVVAIGLTFISVSIYQILVINDDDTFYRNVIKRQARKHLKSASDLNTPGILFLQIDGLAYNVLQRAIRDGNVPTLTKWLRSGNYRMEAWETDWSSQTGASQAGILMGTNKDIPAFRWYEKETGRSMIFGSPDDLTEIEKRISNKNGLLSENGASRGNLLSGDASFTLMTVSTVKNPDKKNFGQDYYAYFANPYNFTRTVILIVRDIISEVRSALDQKRRDVQPRLDKRGRFYPLVRAWTTVVLRDIVVQTLIADMYKGRSVMYADFVGYDEISHHSGIERHETLAALRDIDQQFSRLVKAAADAPRPYHFVILSDHGQTQGATFSQRTGYTLENLVERLTRNKVDAETKNNESINLLNAAVTEASRPKNFPGRVFNALTKNFHKNGKKKSDSDASFSHNIKIMASGCLGLIYFTQYKHRLTLEEINYYYPDLISGLLANPYIGFLLVNSKKSGGIALGQKGTYFLKDDHIEGENPLSPFGDHTAMHIKRTNAYKHVGDIMINSVYDKTMDEVAAFEELIGSHGGLGGNQSHPFIFFPNNWYYPDKPVIGAENVHAIMKHWLADTSGKKYTGRYR